MKFGLEQNTIDKLIAVFEQFAVVDKAIIFGSRAKGNYRPDSDIDIAIKGQGITTDDIIAISIAFEEKGITHKIDLINYNTINEPALKDHIDRVGIELCSRWSKVKLNDICKSIISGGTPLTSIKEYYDKGTIAWIKTKEVLNNKIYDSEYKITELGLLKSSAKLLPINSIIIAMYGDGDTAGRIAINKIPLATNQACGNLIINRDIADFRFVFYYLLNSYDELVYLKSGSGQQNLNLKTLKDFTIKLPPLQEQNAIASILTCLDNKIDLLHRQNKTLELLAETLFRQWFVVEAEENWEEKSFADLIETTLGGEWGKENPEGEYQLQVQCIRGTDIADLESGIPTRTPIRFIKQKKFESIEIKDGDLIMEISGGTDNQSTGRTAYINEEVKRIFKFPLVFSNFCRLIRPKKKEYSFFLYSYIHHLYKQGDLFNLENGSSGIKNLNYKALLFDLEYKMPNEKAILKFNTDVELYYHKINKNKHQIGTLTKTRDALLPKLMSGEIRVN